MRAWSEPRVGGLWWLPCGAIVESAGDAGCRLGEGDDPGGRQASVGDASLTSSSFPVHPCCRPLTYDPLFDFLFLCFALLFLVRVLRLWSSLGMGSVLMTSRSSFNFSQPQFPLLQSGYSVFL